MIINNIDDQPLQDTGGKFLLKLAAFLLWIVSAVFFCVPLAVYCWNWWWE